MTASFSIQYNPPPAGLGNRISSLYEFRNEAAEHDQIERADRPQLRVSLSGQGHYHFANGATFPTFLITIIGPTSGPVRSVARGPVAVVGAGLLPPAWVMLMGAEAERLSDCAIDATRLFGDAAHDLRNALLRCPNADARMMMLAEFLDAALITQDSAPFLFTQQVDAWLSENANPQIDDLLARTGLGLRQLERMTKRYYGLPPKTLARKYRALRAAAVLARGESIVESGLDELFYDQSHLIREVKRFVGFTPTQLGHAHQSRLTNAVAQGRKALTGRVGPLVSDA